MLKNDYKTISNELKKLLNLKKSPVALKFAFKKEDIDPSILKLSEPLRHCEMVQKAANEEQFYATDNEHECKGGSAAIGLIDTPGNIKDGTFYYKLGRFSTIDEAKKTVDIIPKIDTGVYALIYSPLEKIDFVPDILIIISNPKQAMMLSQALIYNNGGKISSHFSGIQSICADAVAKPFINKKPNFTLGCTGSRKYSGILDEEVILGLNGENINELFIALDAIT